MYFPVPVAEGTADYNDAEADLISDATSVTGASLASTHSSRSTVFTKGTGYDSREGFSPYVTCMGLIWSLQEENVFWFFFVS